MAAVVPGATVPPAVATVGVVVAESASASEERPAMLQTAKAVHGQCRQDESRKPVGPQFQA